MNPTLWTLLLLASLGGLLLIPFGLPGTWLIALAAIVVGFLSSWRPFGWELIAGLIVVALCGEVVEQLITAKGARKYGASRAGAWGAFLGSFAGALLGVPIPVPLLGSVVGAFAGAFVGAALGEAAARRTMKEALSSGWGALIGRACATAFKMGLGMAMAAATIVAAWR